MATYVYETTDDTKSVRRFEVKQSMSDAALKVDPESGRPVRRVILGGYGLMGGASAKTPPPQPARSCGSGCGCH